MNAESNKTGQRAAARATVYMHEGRRYMNVNEIDGRLSHLPPGKHDLFLAEAAPSESASTEPLPICALLRRLSNEVAHTQIADQIVDEVAPVAADVIDALFKALGSARDIIVGFEPENGCIADDESLAEIDAALAQARRGVPTMGM